MDVRQRLEARLAQLQKLGQFIESGDLNADLVNIAAIVDPLLDFIKLECPQYAQALTLVEQLLNQALSASKK